jgi:hypothetical protein
MKKIHQLTLVAIAATTLSSSGALVAYWDQNTDTLPGGGFGYFTSSFPQPADQGSGSLFLEDFDSTTIITGGGDTIYDFIENFGGTETNAQPTVGAGGALSPTGGAAGFTNNGMSIVFQVSTVGFTDITVSWAQRGTATGFASRQFDYSTDGSTWTNFATDSGALSATWVTESYDLSSVDSIEEQGSVYFRIVLDGATGTSGNNRFDNLTVQAVPEPTAVLLGSLGLLGILRRRRRVRRTQRTPGRGFPFRACSFSVTSQLPELPPSAPAWPRRPRASRGSSTC